MVQKVEVHLEDDLDGGPTAETVTFALDGEVRDARLGPMGRTGSDEFYVIDLCDEVLGSRAVRQHRFEWLRGDAGKGGHTQTLPVDAYWPELGLVVEYRERQHYEPVPHFDKPDRLTVSGVHRGEQRRLYDARREDLLPAHGLRLVCIVATDLDHKSNGRLHQNRKHDLAVIRRLLM